MPIRVLVVDDSPFVCRLLASHLRSTGDIEVIGNALCGERAIELVESTKPDVVTLDLEMPGIGGLEALNRIMASRPTPVILMSGLSRKAAETTVEALNCGAVDFIPKYTPGQDTDPEALKQLLISKVRLASNVKVIRSLRHSGPVVNTPRYEFGKPRFDLTATPPPSLGPSPTGGILVIGASTGGPTAVRDLLNGLCTDYPAAIVIVQHMPPTFTKAMAEQLERLTPLPVKEAEVGDRLRPGFALVAPGDQHLIIRNDGRIELTRHEKISGHRPSVDLTMQTAAKAYGTRTTGVLLTGMGEDGARGLLAIREAGGHTFAQDEESCVVYGMPARAVEMHAVETVDNPAGIAKQLLEMAMRGRGELAW
jgi:two-component system, chemotaxis family, protein-glutamate methylesterase/glutaminase